MSNKNNSAKGEVVKMLSLISQIGITVLTTIFLCVLVGIFVDKIFGINSLTIFIVLGVLASFKSVYLLLVKVGVLEESKKNNNEASKEEADDEAKSS